MITYHVLKQKMEKVRQLISIVESTGAQAPSLHRSLRNLESAIREFPKAKEEDKLHNEVAEEARQAHAVLQRFLQNLSMACYHFAERGKRDAFNACELKLTRSVRMWQTQNVGFTLFPDEIVNGSAKNGKGVVGWLKKKVAK